LWEIEIEEKGDISNSSIFNVSNYCLSLAHLGNQDAKNRKKKQKPATSA
jgi:hypothetical protein